ATWQLENPVSANLTDVAFVDTLAGFAVGQAGTIIRTRSGGIPVSLPAPPEPPIRNFALLGNFPNPFNPETEIHYQVAAAGQVEFRLVDLNGRLVRRWTEHPATAGRYRLHWDGTDQQGRPVASGVYLLSMQAGPFLQTIKLTLVR
ncbi:MAG: T9SS C-terminal target domain-containing protein, partial [Calditrichaeota bacterium]